MKAGDKVKFSFAKKEKEGVVDRVFEKTVYLKVDMANQKGKIVKRKVSDIKA
jgi:hypothetical protein